MTNELEERFMLAFPDIFRQHDLPMSETCMCWGIETGNGWEKIIWELCEQLMLIKQASEIQVEATQVKEKYGTLNFSTTGILKIESSAPCMSNAEFRIWDDIIYACIERAERRTSHTCEECGEDGELRNHFGWYSVRCDKCWEKSHPELFETSSSADDNMVEFYNVEAYKQTL